MTYTIRMVRPRHCIEPDLGVSTYLDFGATLFSTEWPPYGAHILQGLLSKAEAGNLYLPSCNLYVIMNLKIIETSKIFNA